MLLTQKYFSLLEMFQRGSFWSPVHHALNIRNKNKSADVLLKFILGIAPKMNNNDELLNKTKLENKIAI